MNPLRRLFQHLFPKREIVNCFGQKYLTRRYLFRSTRLSIFLHTFHRSDEDRALHDHPWAFMTIPLWRGYWEHTPADPGQYAGPTKRTRKWPLCPAYRPARWRHRVELVDQKLAVTLFIHFRRVRDWGYHMPGGWKQHEQWWRENCE